MSSIIAILIDRAKAIYWRTVILGVTAPPDERWKVYFWALGPYLVIALVLAIILLETDPHSWRVYIGWGLISALSLTTPLTFILVRSHYNRDNIDLSLIDPRYNRMPDLTREIKIVIAAVLIIPPVIRYIFNLM